MAHDMQTFRESKSAKGILTGKFVFYFRSAAIHRCFLPFITMVDDGTQQHHEHLSLRRQSSNP
jgi:hypothetical protein